MAASLAAGYSVENAVLESGRDLRMIYEENADMLQELAAMQRRMDSNQTLEEAMRDFAERSGIPEAETFAEIFTVGKRSGGDLIEIMEDTARTIAQTVETERAIAATLGVIAPSLVIIMIIAAFISNFIELSFVSSAFAGIRACVCVLIGSAVVKLAKKSLVDKGAITIAAVVFVLALFTSVSPALLVVVAGAIGIVLKGGKGEKK